MSTLFISDLHLCDQQPHITRSFLSFCEHKARDIRALFILGDFFEYWLGDDALDRTANMAQQALSNINQRGIDLYFMAGNRDFLLGKQFATACGMQIIEEPHKIELNGETALLVHGDAQCTDDEPYQHVRTMLRNPEWQRQFLQMPIAQRIEFAQQARMQSKQHTQNSHAEIMDVNPQAIDNLFSQYQVKTIIHGHTHRPAIHCEDDKKRIVLGDWHYQTSYLSHDASGFHLICQ
ncbi:MAG: UDP-2,3-diacylglucosamine diphosphatase [Marinicella sp.]|nr:UDP-2,3-diacylglucosamine diphosphatase [Xanthomonadales bacterium]